MFGPDSLDDALDLLGELLADRGESYELAVIGGGALLLLGFLERPTKDIDVVARVESGELVSPEPMPAALQTAVQEVAAALGLAQDRLNTGPAELLTFGLPDGFLARARHRRFGSLGFWLASRRDQIAFKLYAATDQGPNSKHFQDLLSLAPTTTELDHAGRWCRTHDPSGGFSLMLDQAIERVSTELAGG